MQAQGCWEVGGFKGLKCEGLRVFVPHQALPQADSSVPSAARGSHNPALGLALASLGAPRSLWESHAGL